MKFYEWVGKMVTRSAVVGIIMFFMRVIGISLAWVGAKIITWIFGAYIVFGLNNLLGTHRFTIQMLPAMLVVLYLVGSYLVTTTSVTGDK